MCRRSRLTEVKWGSLCLFLRARLTEFSQSVSREGRIQFKCKKLWCPGVFAAWWLANTKRQSTESESLQSSSSFVWLQSEQRKIERQWSAHLQHNGKKTQKRLCLLPVHNMSPLTKWVSCCQILISIGLHSCCLRSEELLYYHSNGAMCSQTLPNYPTLSRPPVVARSITMATALGFCGGRCQLIWLS